MSKRFGRNQKRKMRSEIEELKQLLSDEKRKTLKVDIYESEIFGKINYRGVIRIPEINFNVISSPDFLKRELEKIKKDVCGLIDGESERLVK